MRASSSVTDEQITSQFAEISKKLDGFEGRLTIHIDSTLSAVEGRLTGHVNEQLAAAVSDLKGQARANTDELKAQAQIYKEQLREDVKKAAEGYEATLNKIDRELGELNRKFDTKFDDHDRVLADHNERLVKLEPQR